MSDASSITCNYTPILSDAVFEIPVLLNPLGTTLSIILFAVFSKFPLLKSSTKS
jgi:hypothetical protein